MIYFLFYLISFIACTVGSICGIGGGVIIKPVLDSFNILSVATISFLSGCTVLAMTCYSVGKAIQKKESNIDLKISTPLAIGGVVGGILGKMLFQKVYEMFSNHNTVGAVQAIVLFFLTLGTMVYTIKMDKIKTHKVSNLIGCMAIGLLLGIVSTFLGIGGGPINLVVLYFFFSMTIKVAAQNSLYVILFSQISSIVQTILSKTIPEFDFMLFIGMATCGILGGVIGRIINNKIDEKVVSKLFITLMGIIMLINVYNICNFLK